MKRRRAPSRGSPEYCICPAYWRRRWDSLAGRTRVVPGDAAATAASSVAHEPLLRLGVAANLLATACYAAAKILTHRDGHGSELAAQSRNV